MPRVQRPVWLWQCNRCGYEWLPRHLNDATPPKRCPGPNCKSPYWNTERQTPKAASKARKRKS